MLYPDWPQWKYTNSWAIWAGSGSQLELETKVKRWLNEGSQRFHNHGLLLVESTYSRFAFTFKTLLRHYSDCKSKWIGSPTQLSFGMGSFSRGLLPSPWLRTFGWTFVWSSSHSCRIPGHGISYLPFCIMHMSYARRWSYRGAAQTLASANESSKIFISNVRWSEVRCIPLMTPTPRRCNLK